jgi:hypothetical protein
MIFGSHVIMYSADAEADRTFLAEKFGFESVDAGGGWLIFGLPPAEMAVHPAPAPAVGLYLMCDDLAAEMAALSARGVLCSEVAEARWGLITEIRLPGGSTLGLYQPRHPTMVAGRD